MRTLVTCLRLTFAVSVMHGPLESAFGQTLAPSKLKQAAISSRINEIKSGMTSDQVLKRLGKPDEVRRRGKDGLPFDGAPCYTNETERWAYGTLGNGKFASAGIVCFSDQGRVVAAMTPDRTYGVEELKKPGSDKAVETPLKLTCAVSFIKYELGFVHTTVSVNNAGTADFFVKRADDFSFPYGFVCELLDSNGKRLFVENMIGYLSGRPRTDLHIPPHTQKSGPMNFSPASDFGSLPPGKYKVRVYFPFEENKFYPSNTREFEVRESPK